MWRWYINDTNQANFSLQENALRYADVKINDINQTVLSVGWTHALNEKALLFSNVFYGADVAQNDLSNGANYSRNNYGLRLSGQWQVEPRTSLQRMPVVAPPSAKINLPPVAVLLPWEKGKIRPSI